LHFYCAEIPDPAQKCKNYSRNRPAGPSGTRFLAPPGPLFGPKTAIFALFRCIVAHLPAPDVAGPRAPRRVPASPRLRVCPSPPLPSPRRGGAGGGVPPTSRSRARPSPAFC
jgi:hypothetical protein